MLADTPPTSVYLRFHRYANTRIPDSRISVHCDHTRRQSPTYHSARVGRLHATLCQYQTSPRPIPVRLDAVLPHYVP
eukprot:1548529-Rhodomonas_salina.1